MRLDKLLVELNIASRSEAKTLIKKGAILVNGQRAKKPEDKVDENTCVITFAGKDYSYRQFEYYLLNKPSGVITATEDLKDETVMDVFYRQFPEARRDLSPVGRLDKDTTGLLLITNNGQLAHDLLSPKKHVDKKYFVTLNGGLTPENIKSLEEGVHIGEGENTAPATVEYEGGNTCFITIHEGKFHQVKRMFFAVGREVVGLKRVSFGPWLLDEEKLPLGKAVEVNID